MAKTRTHDDAQPKYPASTPLRVRNARTQPAVARLPGFLPFQHPKLVERPPLGEGWLHEVKLDGYRMQLRIARGKATWFTRTGLDWSDRFGDFEDELAGLPDAILDGELCALDAHGHPSFSALRSALGKRQAGTMAGDLVFYAFDLLWEGRRDLRALPLEERRERLQAVLEHAPPRLTTVQPVDAPADQLFEAACGMGLEGLVSKRLGSPYQGGEARPTTWLKVKCRPGQEVVIGGWRTEKGTRFRSLMAGVWGGDKLRYVGRIHTGYSADVVNAFLPRLRALETARSPFQLGDPPSKTSDIHWVKPEMVANVEFAEWTGSGKLRQASFKGLRDDKPAREVVEEVAESAEPSSFDKLRMRTTQTPAFETPHPEPVEGRGVSHRASARRTSRTPPAELHGVPIHNPDKLLWPGVTKLDLARYYAAAAEWMLPYIAGRPCTVVAAPDGIGGPVTYVRHEGHWQGPLRTSTLIRHMTVEAKGKTYPVFDTVKALVEAADLGVVEFHPWNSAPNEPMTPDRLVFDLDPEEGQRFEAVAQAARELESRLLHFGLLAFLKTSGKRGLHMVTPLDQERRQPVSWAQARGFAADLCRAMAADSPDRYTTALPKAERRGRLFLDYLRNDPGHHAVGLLSPRTVPEASVSMPIDWKALRAPLDPRAFTVREAPRLLREKNPWKAYAACARPLRV